MGKANPHIIDPRLEGRGPLALKQPVFDETALARADEALKAMSGSFQEWVERDVEAVQTARAVAEKAGWTYGSLEGLHCAAHDLKGMGGAYDYPLVTQIAASLCRLIETDDGKTATQAQPALATAHVDALRAAVRDQIRNDGHPVGRALLRTLEARVASLGVAPR